MTKIDLLFLGAPTVLFDDRPYLFERTKSIALLSYLVVTARPQSRDWLAHLLWSDSKSGRTQVRVALAELTSTPLAQHLTTTREQIGFSLENITIDTPTTTKSQSPVVADMDVFHTIYRGDFLQGLTIKNAPDFERWQRTQATRYRLWFESQVERIVQQCLRQEQYHLAIPHVEKVLEHDPLNERFCRYAILLWSKLSERHRAVSIYQRLQTELAPFDMQPEHTTQLLFQQLDNARWIQLQDIENELSSNDLPYIPVREPLIGRQFILHDTRTRLQNGQRLFTVLGQSGIGKTHFAQVLAHQCQHTFSGGAFMIEIDNKINGAILFGRIANALSIDVSPFKRINQLIRQHLMEAPTLLLIDNIHLVEDASAAIHLLLTLSPHLCIIVTSQNALNLKEEYRIPLSGLTVSDESSQRLAPTGALRLFLQVSQRANPSFELNEQSLEVATEICRLVDGLPIGIILAATWTNMMTVVDILNEVKKSYQFLEAPYNDLSSHHHSMTALFDHLWERLQENERNALQVASVFRGSFSRMAIQEIGNFSHHTLRSLVDKHLITLDTKKRSRYQLPNLLRQYAEDKLTENESASAIRYSHTMYYIEQIKGLESALKGHLQQRAWTQLAGETDNITVAWRFLIQRRDVTLIETLIEPLRLYLQASGMWGHGVELFDEARLAFEKEDMTHTQTYWCLVSRLYKVKHNTMAQLHLAYNFALKQDNQFEIGHTLCEIGWQSISKKDYRSGKTFFKSAQKYWQTDPFYQALLAKGLAFCAIGNHAYDEAQHHTSKALQLRQQIGDSVGEHEMLIVAGELALISGDLDQARTLLDRAFDFFQSHFNHESAYRRCIARGWLYLFDGNLVKCDAFANRLLAFHSPLGELHAVAYALLSVLMLLQGKHKEAQKYVDELQFMYASEQEWTSAMNVDNLFFAQLCSAIVAHFSGDNEILDLVLKEWKSDDSLYKSKLSAWIAIVSQLQIEEVQQITIPEMILNQPWLALLNEI